MTRDVENNLSNYSSNRLLLIIAASLVLHALVIWLLDFNIKLNAPSKSNSLPRLQITILEQESLPVAELSPSSEPLNKEEPSPNLKSIDETAKTQIKDPVEVDTPVEIISIEKENKKNKGIDLYFQGLDFARTQTLKEGEFGSEIFTPLNNAEIRLIQTLQSTRDDNQYSIDSYSMEQGKTALIFRNIDGTVNCAEIKERDALDEFASDAWYIQFDNCNK